MWNGNSNYSNGNSFLADDVLVNLEAPLFRRVSSDIRYQSR